MPSLTWFKVQPPAPTHWRTSNQDADANPEFVDVWLNSFDAISPWSIGRYSNEEEADRFAQENMKGDVELIKRTNDNSAGTRKIEYIPGQHPCLEPVIFSKELQLSFLEDLLVNHSRSIMTRWLTAMDGRVVTFPKESGSSIISNETVVVFCGSKFLMLADTVQE